ncbi:ATP-binding protein [Microcella flavibacter]|uniref:ATP-binding protein n=1 Tax=Microcella flavibacter TaxID=1804990 RepID=UPI00145652BE|nr:ATP-binding protein [Microcella flavibacter]
MTATIELDDVNGQWRLAEIQVANWGTFDGAIYRFPVARRGHLITGPSGSGKSSLLDAIAAVLTPDKWLRFNAAAQGAGTRSDQRSIMSYVRGAWSRTTDEFEDRVVSAYLRPTATWSGILLRFENEIDRPVTLCRIFFARGTSTAAADLADLCLIERAPLDLREIEPFARSGIETRRVQAQWPDAVVSTGGSHAKFYSRLRALFGIPHDDALQLLHKTQSAKSLDSLDQLFREYMLERPTTFDLAQTAVDQFGELRDAHDHVVQLREQRDHLLRLRVESDAFDAAHEAAQAARILTDAVAPYRLRRGVELAHDELSEMRERLIGLRADAQLAREIADRIADDYDVAQRRTVELGGGDVVQLEHRIGTARIHAQQTEERAQRFARQLGAAGIHGVPSGTQEFAELMAEIDRMLSTSQNDAPGATYAQQDRLSRARGRRDRIDRAIDVLRRSGTSVPGPLLAVRDELCEATGLRASTLPFGAELIDVRPEFEAWTGAIERVLRPLALTMLVRSENLPSVRRWVDTNPVRARLVFEEVRTDAAPVRAARAPSSIVNRVRVSAGPFETWIASTLSDRFDFACVDHPDQLDDHSRAITINGQIKSSRTRYEKDDRVALDDRGHWVLGDHHAKLEALVAQRVDADLELGDARAVVDDANRRRDAARERLGALRAIREQSWRDLDVSAAASDVTSLEHNLRQLTRGDSDLQAAIADAAAARQSRDDSARRHEDARVAVRRQDERCRELEIMIEEETGAIASGDVMEVAAELRDALDARFRAVQRLITRTTIAEVAQEVTTRLIGERDRAMGNQTRAGNALQHLITEFSGRWPAVSVDLAPEIADRRGYLDLLDRIVAHGLPEYESRFLQLLRERSRDLIGELVSDILGAPREIEERVHPLNASLRRSFFDEGRFLKLRVKVRRSDTVTRFIKDLQSISAGSWGDDDHATAESRFETLAELMRRFASSDHIDRSWRSQCLDTRLHVTFLAEEIDEHGRVHATYDSGAAMSGGQQQKLVVFCLAAALRYRLAEPDDERTRFGTIVLDEAFDKADTRYTRMALDVFVEFGFHLVLATPQKLLQTIEPYVGAATSIENPTRKRSQLVTVRWSEERT